MAQTLAKYFVHWFRHLNFYNVPFIWPSSDELLLLSSHQEQIFTNSKYNFSTCLPDSSDACQWCTIYHLQSWGVFELNRMTIKYSWCSAGLVASEYEGFGPQKSVYIHLSLPPSTHPSVCLSIYVSLWNALVCVMCMSTSTEKQAEVKATTRLDGICVLDFCLLPLSSFPPSIQVFLAQDPMKWL